MKKALLVALALLFAPQLAEAQSAGGTVTATATVPSALTVTNVSDLNFGQLSGGAGSVIAPGAAPGAGQSLGELEVTHNSDFTVSVTPPSALIHGTDPTETIVLSFECGYSLASGGALVSAAEACASLSNPAHPGDGSTATTFLQVGGTIATTAGAIPGVYTGSLLFTLTAVY